MEKDVPYVVYEAEATRHDIRERRLWIAIIVLAVLLFLSNIAWLYVFNGYDITSESYTIENSDDGNANYLEAGNDGEINNNGIEGNSEKEDSD